MVSGRGRHVDPAMRPQRLDELVDPCCCVHGPEPTSIIPARHENRETPPDSVRLLAIPGSLGRLWRLRSYPDSAAAHGITTLDAISGRASFSNASGGHAGAAAARVRREQRTAVCRGGAWGACTSGVAASKEPQRSAILLPASMPRRWLRCLRSGRSTGGSMIPAASDCCRRGTFAPRGRYCGRSERALSRDALGGLDSAARTEDCAQVLHG
jgi:hypothetical protein